MDTKELQNELIEAIDGFKRITKEAEEILKVMDMGVYSITNLNGIKLVSWSDGSWEDISAMLEAHYRGDIDITKYWKTEDTREIELNNGDKLYLTLIGSKHDNLVEDLNGITKASFTIQTKYCFGERRMFNAYDKPYYSSWSDSDMRTYLNTEFKKTLPHELQYLIKSVKKNTYRYGFKGDIGELFRGSTTTEDSIFLLSEMEVYGAQTLGTKSDWGRGDDGTQYEYYKISSNRIKYLGKNEVWWWLRSSRVNSSGNSRFRFVYSSGSAGDDFADITYGLAPAFCI